MTRRRYAKRGAPVLTGMERVVYVLHAGEPKMVGKLFQGLQGVIIFLHEALPNQRHDNYRSPGGLDTAVVRYLMNLGVERVYHRVRGYPETYSAPLALMEQRAVKDSSGGRNRYYLPDKHWSRVSHRPWGYEPYIPDAMKIVLEPEPFPEEAARE